MKNRITWSEPSPPVKDVSSYDHIKGCWQNFHFLIEWKSWKDFDSRAISVEICLTSLDGNKTLPSGFMYLDVAPEDTNESAKQYCEKWLETFIEKTCSNV